MVTVDLALQLRSAGLRWAPARGDRFVLPGRGMDDDIFVLSDMTVEVHDFPTGSVIGFNGVTEWALDSVQQTEAVWIPSEEQLRERLGGLFTRLDGVGGVGDDRLGGYLVTITMPDGVETHPAPGAADAYGAALLSVLRAVQRSDAT